MLETDLEQQPLIQDTQTDTQTENKQKSLPNNKMLETDLEQQPLIQDTQTDTQTENKQKYLVIGFIVSVNILWYLIVFIFG